REVVVRSRFFTSVAAVVYLASLVPALLASVPADSLDRELSAALAAAGFTGRIQASYQSRLESTLGRAIDPKLADLGRLLWFDTLHSLHADNTCGGCH